MEHTFNTFPGTTSCLQKKYKEPIASFLINTDSIPDQELQYIARTEIKVWNQKVNQCRYECIIILLQIDVNKSYISSKKAFSTISLVYAK